MFKTIIFDLGGVYFKNGTNNAIKSISYKYKIPKEKVADILKGDLGIKYRCGKVSANQFWEKAKKYWKINASNKRLANLWFREYPLIKGTSKIIDRLKKAGYELVILSDNVKERVEYLDKKYHFLNKFKCGSFSHLARTLKPNIKIYKIALKKSSSPAKECIYIDDNAPLLVPANRLGMKTIAFKNPSQLEGELKEAGLKF
jgi:HAD superfamily hydrolase (TIGR01509 family)